MPKLKLLSAAIVTTLAVVACASPTIQKAPSPGALEAQLVGALLEAAEQEGGVSKVLLAPDLPPGIKSAIEAVRPAVAADSSEIVGLAKGQLLVQSASLGQSQASLSARLGPVPRPKPDTALLACGTGLTVTFNLVGGQWEQSDLQVLQC